MYCIKNVRCIDPSYGLDEITDVLIEGNKVKKIGRCEEDGIDGSGCILTCGFVDTHVHFRDPGFTYKADMETETKAALKGGYTAVICMANTKPVIDSVELYEEVMSRAEKLPLRIFQASSITKGLAGRELVDFKALKDAGVKVFTDDGRPLLDDVLCEEAMHYTKRFDTILSFHEEDPKWIAQAGVNEEIAPSIGLQGASAYSEDIMVARDCLLALKTGARVNIQHISSRGAVEMVRSAKKLGAKVYAEVTPHHFSLTQEAVLKHGTYAKMNPPLRSEADRIALIEGLKDGTIDCIATDHAPHTDEDKLVEFSKAMSGIIGLETALSLGITYLVKPGYLTLQQFIRCMSINPAEIYGLPCGHLVEGGLADLVMFKMDEEVCYKEYQSKAHNSPFTDQKLFAEVVLTMIDGQIVYQKGE